MRTETAAQSNGSARLHMLVHLTRLHEALLRQVLRDEPPERVAQDLERAAQMAWEYALEGDLSPHSCPDRYCPCHLVLRDNEPEPLPGLRTVAGAPESSW